MEMDATVSSAVVLLTLLGTCANVLAFSIDHVIDLLVYARTRASQEAGSFVPSYLMWTGSSLVLCTLSAASVYYIGPSAAGSGIPQVAAHDAHVAFAPVSRPFCAALAPHPRRMQCRTAVQNRSAAPQRSRL
eukprot:4672161-Pleurochrysis_carterae.AAC.1